MKPAIAFPQWRLPLGIAAALHLALLVGWLAAGYWAPKPTPAAAATAPILATVLRDERPAAQPASSQTVATPRTPLSAFKSPTLPSPSTPVKPTSPAAEPATAATEVNRAQAATAPNLGSTANSTTPLTEPRFDVDVLQNPKPPYPSLSRRLGEEGMVLLRVRVTEDGTAGEVRILKSSGYPRLDEASKDTVARWRFVPARRGDRLEAAWVQVPIDFTLKR